MKKLLVTFALGLGCALAGPAQTIITTTNGITTFSVDTAAGTFLASDTNALAVQAKLETSLRQGIVSARHSLLTNLFTFGFVPGNQQSVANGLKVAPEMLPQVITALSNGDVNVATNAALDIQLFTLQTELQYWQRQPHADGMVNAINAITAARNVVIQ